MTQAVDGGRGLRITAKVTAAEVCALEAMAWRANVSLSEVLRRAVAFYGEAGMAGEQDIWGHWRRAVTDAVLRLSEDEQMVSAVQEVKQIELADGRAAIIYVKVMVFDEGKLLADPASGGLLGAL